jgi:mannose-binding lectin 2
MWNSQSSAALAVVLLAALFSVALAIEYAQPGSAATHTSPVETHHSLDRPFDAHSVYWKFGGSSVFTNKAVRLTPATQDRRGWLWNDFPFEKDEWEINFQMQIGSSLINLLCRLDFVF